jgi:hypothetical protein
MAVTWKKLAYESDVILKTLVSAKGDIIYASGANTPARLAIGTDNYVLTVATDVPAWEAPAAAAAHTLNSHTAANGAVDFNLQQANDLVVKTVANEAALPAADLAIGELCWATGELSLHICTSAT